MSLRLYVDQCVPRSVSESLRVAGHTVEFLRNHLPINAKDPDVIASAQSLDAVLITLNGYFADIILMLIAIFLFFAFLYTRVGFVHPSSTAPDEMVSTTDEVGQPQKPTKALLYSLAVITLQRPDPRPLTATAWSAVLAETILGPIQAALLILAVRRRFMR